MCGYVPINVLIWKILFVSLTALAFFFGDIPHLTWGFSLFTGFWKMRKGVKEFKATERRLSENLKTAVERVNSAWVSLGKTGEITLPLVFGGDRIFDSEGPINTLAWQVLKFNGGVGSLAKEFEDTVKKLNCPSKEDVKFCISRVRYKLAL
ncbi:uncharacterized protein LOC119719813 [Patiria miniata]|uniref:Uncharacterized protein n=1 Tax=Patiria miniata TaxID=46514 RepID=A0A913Z2P9_PATMI|nr:uncharacterized protein LOC119719813 [Patiria miniata]